MADAKFEEYKVVVCGPGGAGKSCLTNMLVVGLFTEEYDPTIEDSYRKQVSVDNEDAVLDILDTAGQEEYSSMLDEYLRKGQGFLLVYSITSRESFEEIPGFMEKMLRAKDSKQVPTVLVGNKKDLEHKREVPYDEGGDLAKTMGAAFLESSAKLGEGVEEAFYTLIREVRRDRDAKGYSLNKTAAPGKEMSQKLKRKFARWARFKRIFQRKSKADKKSSDGGSDGGGSGGGGGGAAAGSNNNQNNQNQNNQNQNEQQQNQNGQQQQAQSDPNQQNQSQNQQDPNQNQQSQQDPYTQGGGGGEEDYGGVSEEQQQQNDAYGQPQEQNSDPYGQQQEQPPPNDPYGQQQNDAYGQPQQQNDPYGQQQQQDQERRGTVMGGAPAGAASGPGTGPRDHTAEPWFHGSLSGPEADAMLEPCEPGTFLVRSSAQPGCFAVSWKSDDAVVRKSLVIQDQTVGFYFSDVPHAPYPTLAELVAASAHVLQIPFVNRANAGGPPPDGQDSDYGGISAVHAALAAQNGGGNDSGYNQQNDAYGQPPQQEQDPYAQPQQQYSEAPQQDPYAQPRSEAEQDPYAQPAGPNSGEPQGAATDPYGQPEGPASGGGDPYSQPPQGPATDPYAQQNDPYGQQQQQQQADPYGQQQQGPPPAYDQPQQADPYGQQDPYAQPQQQDPYAQQQQGPPPSDPAYGQPAQQDPYAQPQQQQDAYAQQQQGPPPADPAYGQPAQQDPYGQPQQQDPYAQQQQQQQPIFAAPAGPGSGGGEIRVGARVKWMQQHLGTVRFYGEGNFAKGIWVGIELDEPQGKNDGTVKGQRYFECAAGHGIFTNPNKVEVLN